MIGPLIGLLPMRHSIVFTLPMRPDRTRSAARRNLPPISSRCWLPVWSTLPVSFTAFFSASASWMVSVSGFSQYTSLPFFSASMAMRACQWSGMATMTASTSLPPVSWRKSLTPFTS